VYVPLPPTRPEKVAYLATPQHRWLFYASALAFLGVAVSMGGMARHSPATVLFLVPLALWLVEQVVTLRTSTFTSPGDVEEPPAGGGWVEAGGIPFGRRLPPDLR
jgi:hypothetical protein